jgi:hypothetical protein
MAEMRRESELCSFTHCRKPLLPSEAEACESCLNELELMIQMLRVREDYTCNS